MFLDLIINVVSNVISTLIVALISVASLLFTLLINRKSLLRFFGVNENRPSLKIYISRLEIKPGGTEALERINQGYVGAAIAKTEYEAALLIRELLHAQLISTLPKSFQHWISEQNINLSPLKIDIDISPAKDESMYFNDNLVIIGNGIYNRFAKFYLDHESSKFRFSKDAQGVRILTFKDGGEIPGRSVGRELGIINKIKDHDRVVFLCAGLGSNSTYGSVRFLVQNWSSLERKYKNCEFAICLGFENQPYDGGIVVQPSIIHEFIISS